MKLPIQPGVQGPISRRILQQLRRWECRNLLFIEPDQSWPIVWQRARGSKVWDADGCQYLDLTAAFGVAAAGHANPAVVRAGQRQMSTLLHAMGDVHPHPLKAELARRLSAITFERWCHSSTRSRPRTTIRRSSHAKTIFCNSGFEAVEASLKTALLATGKPGIIAFEQGYHGLGYGALNATHRTFFRGPFLPQLAQFALFLPFPTSAAELHQVLPKIQSALSRRRIGAVLVEPIQARGGIRVPPPEFLPELRRLCDRSSTLLILDEIYTGFGRTGKWFATEHSHTIPDLICLGKALTGGFPLSACVGPSDLLDAAWPASSGEAIHTSTFLGHPVGCAMALAQITEIKKRNLPAQAAKLGSRLRAKLQQLTPPPSLEFEIRGAGLLVGLDLRHRHSKRTPATAQALSCIKALLRKGFILLPEGEHSNVISFTPPLTITERELDQTVNALQNVFDSS